MFSFFVYTVKQKQSKISQIYKRNFVDFLKCSKIKFWWRLFENSIISINLHWGSARSHTKCGPDRFSRFDVYWIQTDSETIKQQTSCTKNVVQLIRKFIIFYLDNYNWSYLGFKSSCSSTSWHNMEMSGISGRGTGFYQIRRQMLKQQQSSLLGHLKNRTVIL